MSDWNPDLYRRFENERTRPAAELLARVPLSSAHRINLGCGPGNSTELLAVRFGAASIVGIDNSPAMIDALPQAQRPGFLDAYESAIAAAYPPRTDGRRLLAFPRLFIVAQRAR